MPKSFMSVLVLCLSVVLYSCQSRTDAEPENIHLEDGKISQTGEQFDTVFLRRSSGGEPYAAVFVDSLRSQKFIKRLSNFTLNSRDQDNYNSGLNFMLQENDVAIQLVPTDLPQNWLPVFWHENAFHLYAPSDWGNAGRLQINDSAYVRYYMDGPLPYPLLEAKLNEAQQHIIEFAAYSGNGPMIRQLRITEIDASSRLSYFQFAYAGIIAEFGWYIPLESVDDFPIIVNYSRHSKQMEYEFETIDPVGYRLQTMK